MHNVRAWLRRSGAKLVLLAMAFVLLSPTLSAAAPAPAGSAADATSAQVSTLARRLGKAQSAMLDWVLANSGPLTGNALAGPFRVAYTITPAEGWWEMADEGKLAWHEPPASAVHLRVFVLDGSDGRLVNDVTVVATLVDANRNEQPAPVAFGWYPLINAYGGNLPLPADGSYRLRVSIVAPVMRSTPPSPDEAPKPLSEIPAHITSVEFPAVVIEQNQMMLQPIATETAYATQAQLLKPGNDALGAALTALWQQSAAGIEKPSGDYFVAFAVGDTTLASPLSSLRSKLDFGARQSTPLEILIRDSRTGRPIPTLTPHAQLISSAGTPVDGGELVPLRRPWLNVYGIDLHLARKQSYRLRVRFAAPSFRRWGRQSARFAQPATVEFENVSLEPRPESKTR